MVSKRLFPKFLKIKRGNVNAKCSEIILKKIFGDHPLNPVKLFGHPFFYLPEHQSMSWGSKYYSFYSLVYLLRETILWDQYCTKELIKNGDVVIDAGVHIGDFSTFVNSSFPSTKVFGFEPSKHIYDLALKNIDPYSENIKIYNQALGSRKDTITLLTGNDIALWGGDIVASSEFLKNREAQFNQSHDVIMTNIDAFVEENGIDHVDFIKIDTEGFEKEVIIGASEVIKKHTPTIVCSAYHLKDDKKEIPKLLLSINPNYTYKLEERVEEDFIFTAK